MRRDTVSETAFDRRWEQGPKVVAIGGGTGLDVYKRQAYSRIPQ